ncbi:hypothetical protein ACH5RR_038985 [Cinchona calisaya]|uniref:RNase H type-1 domain-containing protein n=1 Tax=Cinchona calisaya TaxID=153742 RepID=A0ABD2Y240_9GENT
MELRDVRRFKNQCPDSFVTIQKSIGEWNEFDWSNKEIREESISETNAQFWSEPNAVTLAKGMRLMVATARNHQERRVGIGIVAVNDQDHIQTIWGLHEGLKTSQDQEIAEAIRFALIKAAEHGWKEIPVEDDNKVVIEMLTRMQ